MTPFEELEPKMSKAEHELVMRIGKSNDPELMMKMLDVIFKEKI